MFIAASCIKMCSSLEELILNIYSRAVAIHSGLVGLFISAAMDIEIQNINVFNRSIEYELADKVNSWTFMDSPLPLISILLVYLAFVTKLGPDYMKTRQPYSLRYTLMVYNAVQVAFSIFIVYHGASILFRHGIFHKQCIINTNFDEAETFVTMFYFYLMAKISELLDTVFFVLRKKNNQVSFLHVYHHVFALTISWLEIKYERNENFAFVGTMNTFVHVIMYAYYGLSATPALRKYLWWKKYITTIQLIQFILAICHLLFTQVISECPLSMISVSVIVGNLIFFYFLFTSFYNKNYVKPEKVDKETNRKYSNKEENGKHNNGISNGKYSNSSQNCHSNGISNGNGVQDGNRYFNSVYSKEMANGKYVYGLQNRTHGNGK